MREIIYQLICFEGKWFYQRISDGKLIKRVYI